MPILMFQQFDDQTLIKKWKKENDNRLLGELYRRYSHLVLGVCIKYLKNKEEAQDAAMDIFEKITSDLKKTEITYFKSWLYQVSKNHCLMKLRKKGITITDSDFLLQDSNLYISEPLPLEDDTEQQTASLEKCMEQLRLEQKKCIDLFFLQEKSYKEVSELTGFDFNAVKSYVQNGKLNLKKCMESSGGK